MIIAFDPGGTTGGAAFDFQLGKYHAFELDHGKYPHPHEILFDTLNAKKPQLIIYESFLHRQKMNINYTGLQYIGVIELWAEITGTQVHQQNAGEGKAFWSDDKLKAMGLWIPSKRHAMDAMKHLLTYRAKHDMQFQQEFPQELRANLRSVRQ